MNSINDNTNDVAKWASRYTSLFGNSPLPNYAKFLKPLMVALSRRQSIVKG